MKKYLEEIEYIKQENKYSLYFYLQEGVSIYPYFYSNELDSISPEYKDTKASDYYFLKGWNWNHKGKTTRVIKTTTQRVRHVIPDEVWAKIRNEKSK